MDKNTKSAELAELKAKLEVYEQWHNDSSSNQIYSDDEISLKEIWNVIWLGKWKVIVITSVFAIASVLYALSLPNIYKSEALLMPNSQDTQTGGLGALAGQFGGLASLAGISLGGGDLDKTTYALEVLKSREFLYRFIENNHLKVPIMAVDGWIRKTDTFTYDEDIYLFETKTWSREEKEPYKPEPSLQETYEEFLKKNLTVSQDKETGIVKVSVSHYSPYLAQYLVEQLVTYLNETIKKQDMDEANKSISYYMQELNNIKVSENRVVFYQLIEQQQQTLMLTKVRDDYILRVIDKAVVPEEETSPKRALICIMGTLLGSLFAVFYILILQIVKREK